ncbi:DUF732 domain-containing protein [Pseudonocardia sp. NPDC049154]|uniref:DUF732 domain-containing protein n=1 Tax=Pseudonocardia sp. NPDC049154 TaxID=3155501 RepID=UPI0033E6002B
MTIYVPRLDGTVTVTNMQDFSDEHLEQSARRDCGFMVRDGYSVNDWIQRQTQNAPYWYQYQAAFDALARDTYCPSVPII